MLVSEAPFIWEMPVRDSSSVPLHLKKLDSSVPSDGRLPTLQTSAEERRARESVAEISSRIRSSSVAVQHVLRFRSIFGVCCSKKLASRAVFLMPPRPWLRWKGVELESVIFMPTMSLMIDVWQVSFYARLAVLIVFTVYH